MFDDGELLVVPAPQSRHSPDYELMMLDKHGYGPGYRHPTNQYRGQRSNHGYVVSFLKQKCRNFHGSMGGRVGEVAFFI